MVAVEVDDGEREDGRLFGKLVQGRSRRSGFTFLIRVAPSSSDVAPDTPASEMLARVLNAPPVSGYSIYLQRQLRPCSQHRRGGIFASISCLIPNLVQSTCQHD
jgi:hypothetical protein